MSDEINRRSTGARIGIVALNLLAPGLGLLRLGISRTTLILLLAPVTILLLSILLFAIAPTATPVPTAIYIVVLVLTILAIYLASFILSWRRSAVIDPAPRWWTRWYGLLLAWALLVTVGEVGVWAAHSFYKPFYLPAESMAPTLNLNEKVVADMRGGRNPARGDIIFVEAGRGIYVKRVAALAGDRIEMRDGVPIINGVAAHQRNKGMTRYLGFNGMKDARLIAEQLPGEGSSHDILDLGYTDIDDMPEVTVPPGHIFLLGDNRDVSADSRVPRYRNGLEMVPIGNIVGRPLFIHWSADRSRIGRDARH